MSEKKLDPLIDIKKQDLYPIVGLAYFVARNIKEIIVHPGEKYSSPDPIGMPEFRRQTGRILAFYAVHSGTIAAFGTAAELYLKR